MTVALLSLATGTGVADAVTQGYLAMYNVRYSNDAVAGELEGVVISFDFDQWIFDYDPTSQTSTPHVFEDLKVNVTFPEPHSGNIFMTDQEATVVLIDHKISLGDVSSGIYHYDLTAELPAVPYYCVALDLPAEYRAYLSTETTFCTPAEMPDLVPVVK